MQNLILNRMVIVSMGHLAKKGGLAGQTEILTLFWYYISLMLASGPLLDSGLPSPNFRNQEFFVKNQELIRRLFSKK